MTMPTCCKIDGCDRSKIVAHGLCDKHYRQAKRAKTAIRPADLPGERWAPFPGIDRVLVSTHGRVKSIRCQHKHIICKPRWTENKNGAGPILVANVDPLPFATVHLAILRAFVPNPDDAPRGVFIDGDTRNCCLSNLRWADQAHYLPLAMSIAQRHGSETSKALLRYWHGDRLALNGVISEQYRVLPTYVKRRIDTYGLPYYIDAEDVAQESVIAGLSAIDKGQIDPARNIHAWWWGIAKRQTFTAIRRHSDQELSADFAPRQLLAGHFAEKRCS